MKRPPSETILTRIWILKVFRGVAVRYPHFAVPNAHTGPKEDSVTSHTNQPTGAADHEQDCPYAAVLRAVATDERVVSVCCLGCHRVLLIAATRD